MIFGMGWRLGGQPRHARVGVTVGNACEYVHCLPRVDRDASAITDIRRIEGAGTTVYVSRRHDSHHNTAS